MSDNHTKIDYKFNHVLYSPCKIGDTVWYVWFQSKHHQNPAASRRYVSAIHISDGVGYRSLPSPSYAVLRVDKGDRFAKHVSLDEFGKTVFLSLDDAKLVYPDLAVRFQLDQ